MSVFAGLIAIAVLAGTVEVWVDTWPSFGMTLIAVPASLVALAFGNVAVAAAKAAFESDPVA